MKNKTHCSASEHPAMASVPYQKWCEPFDFDKALEEGTVFPCMYLPFFCGENNCSSPKPFSSALDPIQSKRESLMSKIYSISFAINDLTLYLDTHPDCPDGTPLFYQLTEERLKLLAEFARENYPLTQSSMITGELNTDCYAWSEGPMPWEGGCI